MLDQSISNRNLEYQSLLKRWADFYNIPLARCLKILRADLHWTAAKIKKEVFQDAISEDGVNDFIQRNSKETK